MARVNVVIMGAAIVGGLVACLALVVLLIRDDVAGDPTFILLGAIELVLLVQLVFGCIALAGTDRDVNSVMFVSYLIGVCLALPIGAFWSLAERTRAGTAVLLVATLTVVALEFRLDQIWAGHVGA